ncbi:MAG: nicotinate-nucleotide adenylyltransferase [Nitrosomonas sp.]|nr:nicotinate-nucleotide adenylyltransferase [Nitrosomonas sp.]
METIDKFPLVGIYGGTFDPIHYGHLRIAEELLDIIGLKRTIFVPSGAPRLRAAPVAARNHRATMVRLAIQDNDMFTLDEREISRSGISTTVESLREYQYELGENMALCFILGIDAFIKINQWHNWHELFSLCHLIIVARPGYTSINDHQNLPADIRKELIARRILCTSDLGLQPNGCIYIAQTSLLEISASHIRSLITAGKSTRYLLPEIVSDYIKSNYLYVEKI